MRKIHDLSKMTLQKPNLTDIKALFELESASFDRFSSPLSKRAFRYHIDKNFMLAAKENGEILGYILIFAYLKTPRIYSLAVSPKARGKGVAKALISEVLSWFESLRLEVRVDNVAAINLYKKFGFKQTKTLSKYYDDGCDALEMIWLAKREFK
ncbi:MULTISPECIES: GNAT family N-acetyltransferase [unclassified Campylobacter]|uniref:GNAT family N-acetyltransferase n=1 Tax=unclassified Campylobacter TaxID=2593542 RepID=UPI0020160AA8|nr:MULTISPECIES: GNAT family N-acetyltransferase [unclassified Campylobacter]